MENRTGYDLNAAVEEWRQELAGQPGLAPEDRLELETHLRETIAELRGQGLNDEEAFWLARRRIGQPVQLAGEFVKADPARAWRERVFWMAVILLFMSLWGSIAGLVGNILVIITPASFWKLLMHALGVNYFQIVHLIFFVMPVIVFAVLMARGRLAQKASRVRSFLTYRVRFIVYCSIAVCIAHGLVEVTFPSFNGMPGYPTYEMIVTFLLGSIWDFALIALAAWLMPAQDRRDLKLDLMYAK